MYAMLINDTAVAKTKLWENLATVPQFIARPYAILSLIAEEFTVCEYPCLSYLLEFRPCYGDVPSELLLA